MASQQRKRLTITFNRAVVKPWEEFEILLPSSEQNGYEWTLRQQASKPFEVVASDAFPAFEPRARKLVLSGSQYGKFEVEMLLAKPDASGMPHVRERRVFTVTVK